MNEQNTNQRILKNINNRAPGSLTKQDLLDAYNFFKGKCPYSETKINQEDWHLEHIIPVSMGGTTDPWNCIPVCGPCNLSKGGDHLLDWWDKTHTKDEEYKLENILVYILKKLSEPRNYRITTIEDKEIIKLIGEERKIEEEQQFNDENYIHITKKLDTFTFLRQVLDHLTDSKMISPERLIQYNVMLEEIQTKNKELGKLDIEVYDQQKRLTKYLKELGVIKHYSIVYEYSDKIGNIEEIKKNVEEIQEYIGKDSISDLINKNPEILFMNVRDFSSKLEYIVNVLGISLNVFLERPTIINQTESLRKLLETCEKNDVNINDIPNWAYL